MWRVRQIVVASSILLASSPIPCSPNSCGEFATTIMWRARQMVSSRHATALIRIRGIKAQIIPAFQTSLAAMHLKTWTVLPAFWQLPVNIWRHGNIAIVTLHVPNNRHEINHKIQMGATRMAGNIWAQQGSSQSTHDAEIAMC